MSDTKEATVTITAPKRNWRQDIREAIMGSEQNFTEGAIGRAIFILSIPMILEMSMESLFGIVDVFFVSRLGADAVATVGLTESLLTIIFAIAIGLSMATTAMVARRIGENDQHGASVAAMQSIFLGVAISIPISLVGVFFAGDLLALMGASESIVRDGSGYTIWMITGNVTIVFLFLNNAIFRGAGDAVSAMRALWLANIINIILDPCLIFGWGPFPELGITGAAIATNIGRGTGVLYQFYLMFHKGGRITLTGEKLKFDPAVMWSLIKVSIGGIIQFLITTASWLGLVRIISLFGSSAVAGYTIAIRIIIVAILPAWGMSNAAATLVGQNLGAGKPDRAEGSVLLAAKYNMIFLSVVAVIFIILAEPMIRFFTDDPAVIAYGVDCLRFISYGYPAYAWGMVLLQAFNGAGDTRTPTWINFFCYWMFQIPLAYSLAVFFGWGAHGAFAAVTIAETFIALAGIVAFRIGKWKEQKI